MAKSSKRKPTKKYASGGTIGDAYGGPGPVDHGDAKLADVFSKLVESRPLSAAIGQTAKNQRGSRAAPTRGMKAGGATRGDGVCRQGKTKGKMR